MTDALEDLVARARRDELTGPEQQRLDMLLDNSAEARLFHRLGRRFDGEDPAPPIADAASQAIVEALLKQLHDSRNQKRRTVPRWSWLIAAAALFVASLAGAVIGVQRLRSLPAPTPSATARSSVSPDTGRAIGRAQSSVVLPSAPSQEPATPSLSAELPLPRPASSSAAELLSAAGRARRSGQPTQALELLQTLRARYPNSPEASASEITLGKLELERGAAAAALGDFDGYLRHSPGGALTPEALWGRSQALTQLGKSAEAQQSLRELLQRFPSSPYTSAARAKLSVAVPARP